MASKSTWIPLGVLVLLCLFGRDGSAQPESNPYLGDLRKNYDALNFKAVVDIADKAMALPGNTPQVLLKLLWYKGSSLFYLNNKAASGKVLKDIFDVNPLFFPPEIDTPPDLKKYFEEQKAAYQKQFGITLAEELSFTSVRVRVKDPLSRVTVVVFHFKPLDSTVIKKIELRKADKDNFEASLGAGLRKAFDYWIEAVSRAGIVVGRKGSAEKPVSFYGSLEKEAAKAAVETKKVQPIAEQAAAAGKKKPDLEIYFTVSAIAGGSALAAGVVLSAMASSSYSKARNAGFQSDVDKLNKKGDSRMKLAWIFYGAGALLCGAAAAGFLIFDGEEKNALDFSATAGPGWTGLRLGGSF